MNIFRIFGTYLCDEYVLKIFQIFVCFKETQPKHQHPFHDLSSRSLLTKDLEIVYFSQKLKSISDFACFGFLLDFQQSGSASHMFAQKQYQSSKL